MLDKDILLLNVNLLPCLPSCTIRLYPFLHLLLVPCFPGANCSPGGAGHPDDQERGLRSSESALQREEIEGKKDMMCGES